MSSNEENSQDSKSVGDRASRGDDCSRDSISSHESNLSHSKASSKVSSIAKDTIEPQENILDFEEDVDEEEPESGQPLEKEGEEINGSDKEDDNVKNDDVETNDKDEIAVEPEEGEEEESQEAKEEKEVDSDLEDGEVKDSDDDEAGGAGKPPICRFFSKGQCRWGTQCRFQHPGLSGPHHGPPGAQMPPLPPHMMPGGPRAFGPMGPGGPFPIPPFGIPPPMESLPPVVSAWERGLRNSKELMKEAMRKREEDPTFEDKRLHQGLQASPLRENRSPSRPLSASPSPPLRSRLYGSLDKAGRPGRRSESPIDLDRWKEERYAAAERARSGQGDTWKDPWRRSKSPTRGRQRRRSRSYSSSSRSYSSSASSYSYSRSSSSRSSSYSRSRSKDRSPRRGGGDRGGKSSFRKSGPSGGGYQANASGGARGRTGSRFSPERFRPALAASPSPTRYRGRGSGGPAGGGTAGGRSRKRSSSSSSSSSYSRSPSRNRGRRKYSSSRSRTPEGIPRRPQPAVAEKPQIKMTLVDKKAPIAGRKRPFSASPSRSPPPHTAEFSPTSQKDNKSKLSKKAKLMQELRAVEAAIAQKKAKV